VDAVGLTLGSIAMDSFAGRFHNAFGEAVASSLDDYYKMDKSDIVPGLDEKGLPAFYSVGSGIKSTLEGAYRLTRGDIERATVLIPNISMIRKGDLLVRYDVAGEPHIGIVAGLGWTETNGPSWTADARDWWSKVYVVSVRRGYRTVSLGSWGNSATVFGGFTVSPESYQIRRLLVKRDDAAQQTAEPPAWELVDEVAVRTYEEYPGKASVPLTGAESWVLSYFWDGRNAQTMPTSDSFVTYQLNRLAEGKMYVGLNETPAYTDRFYQKLLPPTSYSTKAMSLPLQSGEEPLKITQYTGFRCLNTATGVTAEDSLYYHIRYHQGIDIGVPYGTQAGVQPFKAPESGMFYIAASAGTTSQTIKIKSPVDTLLDDGLPVQFSYASYGNIGVLITNPEAPRDGRVYLFCHMEKPTGGDNLSTRQQFYTTHHFQYAFRDGESSDFPTELQNAVYVKAGEEIGHVGNEGVGTAPHMHIEVFEYFTSISGSGAGGWRRIDPVSVFSGSSCNKNWIDLSRDMDGESGFKKIEVYLNSDYKTILTGIKAKTYENVFKAWPLWAYEPDITFTLK
jgi:murein DD-endopeptidase MepM/ murein hydrolase activator NlpD